MKNTPEVFREVATVIVDKLTNYLSESRQGTPKVLIQRQVSEIDKTLGLETLIRGNGFDPKAIGLFLDNYFDNTQHLHHPQFIGHQAAAPHIASSMADFIHGVVNNPMAIYEMGPAAASMERVVVNWMLEKAGWFHANHLSETDNSKIRGGGVLTHGGSMANLTAMLAARAKADPEAWTAGTSKDLVVMCPSVSHYSLSRAISIIGMGSNAVVPVKVNEHEVLDVDDLYPVYQELMRNGKKVMSVVANACATSTGLYDPVKEIGAFCKEHNIWLHVDGAHGAVALLSENEKHFMNGLEYADSLSWDAHKMLQTSALCAAVLVKDHKNLDNTFRQKGSYIFFEKDQIGVDAISNAIECTKSGLGAKLFWAIAGSGEKGMTRYVEHQYKITRDFYTILNNHKDFECPYFPESNILCFRYTGAKKDNDFQLAIRNELTKRGNFYITTAMVNNIRYLRFSVMNEHTSEHHIRAFMYEVVEIAASL